MYPEFQIWNITLASGGIILFLGVLIGLLYYLRIAKNKKIDINFLTNHLIWVVLGTLIGARLGDIIINYPNYDFSNYFDLADGNFDFYVGLISFIILFYFFCCAAHKNFWKYLDSFIEPFLLVMFFLSIGDFLTGKNYGVPPAFTFWPTIIFNSPEVPFYIPIHPVQLYTAFFVAIYYMVAFFLRRKKRTDGVVALTVILIYFIGEFFLEFLRGDYARLIFNYHINQIWDALFIMTTLVTLIIRSHLCYIKIKSI